MTEIRDARFSDDRLYRYTLTRTWDESKMTVAFVGLNPSTADETADDPTIRRCVRFARDWGYGGIIMVNLFALRSTDPKALIGHADPVGPDNDWVLRNVHTHASLVVAAWGAHRAARDRADAAVAELLVHGSFAVLDLTKDGHPRHPLYMPASAVPLDPLTLTPVEIP